MEDIVGKTLPDRKSRKTNLVPGNIGEICSPMKGLTAMAVRTRIFEENGETIGAIGTGTQKISQSLQRERGCSCGKCGDL